MKRAVAIFCSDWHIWGRPSLYRSVEPDWFAAMARPLRQIKRFQKLNGNPIVFVAGDIFDFYRPEPEVINWLIRNMPKNVWAIPGQHDLQNHVYDLIKKTGFWTLVEAGAINELTAEGIEFTLDDEGKTMKAFGKAWGVEPPQNMGCGSADFIVYLAHQYIYDTDATKYTDAPKEMNVKKLKETLRGVDVACFGDNHIPFTCKVGKTQVINSGTLLRRKVDERNHEIGFSVLYDDGTVERELFDVSKDQFAQITITKKDEEKHDKLAAELLQELEELDTMTVDFEEELTRYIDNNKYSKKQKAMIAKTFTKYREGKK